MRGGGETSITTSPESAYDVFVDFNWPVEPDGLVDTDFGFAKEPAVGETLTAGDDEGNTCPATVTAIKDTRVVLRLDWDRFQAAPDTDERETMIAFIGNSGDTASSAGHPKPNLGVIATAGFVWRSPTTNDKPGCLQVAAADDGVFIRDSADPSKVLAFTTAEFAAFCEGVDAGDYRDLLPPII